MVRNRLAARASLVLSLGAAAVLTGACQQPAPAVKTPIATLSPDAPVLVTGGSIRGAASAPPDIISFKGIPFAAPPVGRLRWRAPAPVVPWDGVRDATKAGPICVQGGAQRVTQSEDCLFLNVWAPSETTEPRPVMVWVHGGGFTGGSGSSDIYDGTALAGKGVVLVTINYRLNVFGFLAHPALSAESGHDASGNYGLMDTVAALTWVRDNISTFGGDPERVTLFGESAGAGAVMSLMLVPQARGLFQRAIAESNWVYGWDRPLRQPARGWEPAEAQGIAIGRALGAKGEDALAMMRAASSAQVLAAANAGAGSQFLRQGYVWAPNVDGWIVPDDPMAMYETGRQHDVPLITGMNGNEGSMMTRQLGVKSAADFRSHVAKVYPGVRAQALATYAVASDDSARTGIDHLVHDMYFAGPVKTQARAQAKKTSPAWLYHFTHVPPTGSGATLGSHHASELVYVFGTMTAPGAEAGERPLALGTEGAWTDVDRQLSDRMMSHWTQFAATGNPNRDGLPGWPAYDVATDDFLTLNEQVMTGAGLHQEGARLFDAFEASRRVRP